MAVALRCQPPDVGGAPICYAIAMAPDDALPLPRRLLRLAMRSALLLRKSVWFFTRPRTHGVRAIPVTPEGAVVLVKHTYLPGWHLPGGGRGRGEDPEAAALRELREEIGLTAHAEVLFVGEFAHAPDYRRDTVTLFLVSGVDYAPRRSLEIETIAAFPPRALPEDTALSTRRRIAEWLDGAARPERW